MNKCRYDNAETGLAVDMVREVHNKDNNPVQRLVLKVSVAVACRILFNTVRRFPYTFAAVLSRGLGVPLTAITTLIAVNQATGILGLFFGPLADRFGYRMFMLIALGMLVVGMFAGGLFPSYWVVMGALFLAGLGKNAFDSAIQGYFAHRVPFARRARIVGAVELGWAGSTLIGIPIVGLLMDTLGWRSFFFITGALGVLGILTMKALIAGDSQPRDSSNRSLRIGAALLHMSRGRTVFGALVFIFLVNVANDALFVVYGPWLGQTFDLSIGALGAGTGVIGLAELSGEFLTVWISDRIGLKRSVIIGVILSIVCYAALPVVGRTLPLALISLFSIFLTFEFYIVTFLSLTTELKPEMRATMIAGNLAAAGLGRIVGALMGGVIWLSGGLVAVALTSAFVSCLGLVVLIWGLKRWPNPQS